MSFLRLNTQTIRDFLREAMEDKSSKIRRALLFYLFKIHTLYFRIAAVLVYHQVEHC